MIAAAALEIWNHRLAEVAEHMGLVLQHAALSPNIRERRDYSCAIFDSDGRLLAQAAHIPVHLGSTGMAVRAVLAAELYRDDTDERLTILNDPFSGGTHLPDVTLVAPVVVDGRRLGWVAASAHHADIGGRTPGSMPVGAEAIGDVLPEIADTPPALGPNYQPWAASAIGVRYRAVTIDDEGFRLVPTILDDEVIHRFASSSRQPDERRGDLLAQRAAIVAGCDGLRRLCARFGAEVVAERGRALITYAAQLMRARIALIPNGVYAFADSLDDDGAGTNDLGLRLTLTINGDSALVDLTDSDEQTRGSLNATAPVTLAAVSYAFRLLLPADAPTNEGLWEPLGVAAQPGSLLDARYPAAVAAGNVETSQRVVDVVLGALAQALGSEIPSASCGTMSNVMLGGPTWAYYETVGGGAGASPTDAGASSVQTHMTNTRNTPIEELERDLPLLVTRYARRRLSGGGGSHLGGDGIIREYRLLEDAQITIIGERRRRPPYGLSGGGPGTVGKDELTRDGRTVSLPAKVSFAGKKGDTLRIATPGGGGHGDPMRAKFWAAVLSGQAMNID